MDVIHVLYVYLNMYEGDYGSSSRISKRVHGFYARLLNRDLDTPPSP